jgi:phospholipase D1/2
MSGATRFWVRIAVVLLAAAAAASAWKWTPLRELVDPGQLSAQLEPYRTSWFALPLVVAVFVLAELVMFPVLVLIFVCGVVFGPWLGPLYALTGAVASALPPFWLGRRLGRERLEAWGGERVRRLAWMLERRGVIAVFLVRKIPAPYSLVNLICGACALSLRDFVLGTVLGMVTGVVLLTVLGGELLELLADPDPVRVTFAILLLAATITIALLVQRVVNRTVRRTIRTGA